MKMRFTKITGVLIVCIYVSLFSICPASTEEIYQWVDENGNISYSNIAPPLGNLEYTIKRIFKEELPLNKFATQSVFSKSKTTSDLIQCTNLIDSQIIQKVLQKRIEEGKKVICSIESLLKRNPNNHTLRQHLFRKRICLLEDINRLNNM